MVLFLTYNSNRHKIFSEHIFFHDIFRGMTRFISGLLFLTIAALPYITMFTSEERVQEDTSLPEEKIFIMSPHRREVRLEYSRGFSEWMKKNYKRRVKIEWLDAGGTSKMLKDLESRYTNSPEKPGVDLLFGGGITPYLTAIEKNWLLPVEINPELLKYIPPDVAGVPVYDAKKRWFGVALSGFGILYNRILIERMGLPVPQTWEDLGKPEFFTWLASGDPRSSGSVHMCYEIILQAYGFEKGWDLITRISGNVRVFSESGSSTPREVAIGEVAAGMAIDQYAQTVIDAAGGDALIFVLPQKATVIGADAIALLRGSANQEISSLFIEYCLSKEGQKLLFLPAGVEGQKNSLFRMPVRSDLYSERYAPPVNPYKIEAGFIYDDIKGGKRWNIINDMIGAWLIDAHSELSAAWGKIISIMDKYPDLAKKLKSELSYLPISESDMEALIPQWNEPRIRLNKINEWAREARNRYKRIISKIQTGDNHI